MFATYSGTSQDNFADSFRTAFFVKCTALFFLLVGILYADHSLYKHGLLWTLSKRHSSISNILSAIPHNDLVLIGYQKLPVMWGECRVKRLSAVHLPATTPPSLSKMSLTLLSRSSRRHQDKLLVSILPFDPLNWRLRFGNYRSRPFKSRQAFGSCYGWFCVPVACSNLVRYSIFCI